MIFKVIVTGAGFIGAAVSERLARVSAVGVDNLNPIMTEPKTL